MYSPSKPRPNNRIRKGQDEGFSLVEMLVVLAIMGLLVGLVAPRVLGYLGGAKVDTAKAQIRNIDSALELFFIDNGRYPSDEEGLQVLAARSEGLPQWNGPYLKGADVLRDPWGNPYQYATAKDDRGFVVRSLGRDGKEGGDGEDHDLP